MSKHTHGVWTAEFGEAYNVRAEHGGIVAQIHHLKGRHGMLGRVPAEESAANARLIAASPDLLSALESVLSFEDPDSIEDQKTDSRLRQAREDAWEKAKSAIRKATGDQP